MQHHAKSRDVIEMRRCVYLAQNGRDWPTALLAARERNNTETAHVFAAAHHADEC